MIEHVIIGWIVLALVVVTGLCLAFRTQSRGIDPRLFDPAPAPIGHDAAAADAEDAHLRMCALLQSGRVSR
ncbi:MAG: hypothetical protein ACRYG8_55200 [Janthinobacterium lividum]